MMPGVIALVGLIASFATFSVALTAESVVEQAKREGDVVLYASMSSGDLAGLVSSFERKYPFLKVKTFRGNNEGVLNRILTEGRTGSYFFDVANIDGLNGWVLKEKDYLQPYRSKETEAFPEEFQDPTGLLPCCLYVNSNVIGYNTKLVSKSDAPKSYQDLLHPRWRGQLGMDADEAEWFRALISIWGRDKTVRYFQDLMKQQPSMRRGHTLLAQLTAAGEFPVAVNVFGYRPLELQRQGAPIDIVQADPVIAGPRHISLAKRAPHPNAGRLLMDYTLSAEGQAVLASLGREVVRPGVKLKHPRLVEGVKFHPIKPEMAKNYEEITKLYSSIVK